MLQELTVKKNRHLVQLSQINMALVINLVKFIKQVRGI